MHYKSITQNQFTRLLCKSIMNKALLSTQDEMYISPSHMPKIHIYKYLRKHQKRLREQKTNKNS